METWKMDQPIVVGYQGWRQDEVDLQNSIAASGQQECGNQDDEYRLSHGFDQTEIFSPSLGYLLGSGGKVPAGAYQSAGLMSLLVWPGVT